MSPIYNPYSGNYIQNDTSLFDSFINAIKTTAAIKRISAETEQMNIKSEALKEKQELNTFLNDLVVRDGKLYLKKRAMVENPDKWTNLWGILPKGETQQGYNFKEIDINDLTFFKREYAQDMLNFANENQQSQKTLAERANDINKEILYRKQNPPTESLKVESFIDYPKRRETYDPLYQMNLGTWDKGQRNLFGSK